MFNIALSFPNICINKKKLKDARDHGANVHALYYRLQVL